MVERLFLEVPLGCLRFVIVVFPDHTHLLFMGIWGEWLFIFRDLGSTGNYFPGFGEQAHRLLDSGSPAKKYLKNLTLKEKTSFGLIFKKNRHLEGSP